MQRDAPTEHRAGLFTAAVIALLFAGMFVLQEWRRRPAGSIEFEVLVPIVEGVDSLSAGSDVIHAGLDVGRVEEVTLTDARDALLVRFSVDPRFRLGDGAILQEGVPMVGPRSTLVLRDAGVLGDDEERPVTASWVAGDGLERLLGADPADAFRRAITNLDAATDQLQRVREAEELVDDLRAAVNRLAERVPSDFAKWRESASATLAELPDFTGPESAIPRAEANELRDRVASTRDRVAALEERARPRLERAVEGWNDVRDDLETMRDRWRDRVQPDLDRLGARLDAFESPADDAVVDELRIVGALARHSLARFAADVSLASTELGRAQSEAYASLGLALIARPPADRIDALRELESLRSWAESAETLLDRMQLLDDALAASGVDADPRMRALAADAARTMRTALERHEAIHQDVLSLVGRLLRTDDAGRADDADDRPRR